MGTYNGHANWNQWNVYCWLTNDYGLYRFICDTKDETKNLDRAARIIQAALPERTPDGARYSLVAIRNALRDL